MGYVDLRRQRELARNRESASFWQAAKNSPYLWITVGLILFVLAALVNQAPRMLADPWLLLFADPWFLPWIPSFAFLILGIWQLRRRRPQSARPTLGAEKQLLMAIRDSGGSITPVEAALETSLTVDEAEEILSRLADRGHLIVQSHDGTLFYTLPARRTGALDGRTAPNL